MITFKKIDRRYNGGSIYQYVILVGVNTDHHAKSINLFNEIRKWCEITWGHSCELHDAWAFNNPLTDESGYPIWVWANDSKDSKRAIYRAIYLKTDKEYMLAKLRWE